MKRQRGRGRKPNNPGNRSYESNGPDVKIRGNANQIYEKYLQYGRDAQTSGDRVAAEAYFQHAEHYYRIMAANMPKDRLPTAQDDADDIDDDGRDDDGSDDVRSEEQDGQERQQNNRENNRDRRDNRDRNRKSKEPAKEDVDGLQVVDGEGEAPEEIAADGGEQKESSTRRRRQPRRRKPAEDSADAEGSDDDAGLRAMMARSGSEDTASAAEPVDS